MISLKTHELKKIEEWTNKQCGECLFDSNIDNWTIDSSVFSKRVFGKSHLMIVVEDERGDSFGVYINTKIDDAEDYIEDADAFIFSCEMKNLYRFDIKKGEEEYAICLGLDNQPLLFSVGFGGGFDTANDICIFKKNSKERSYRGQRSFDYKGINSVNFKKTAIEFTARRVQVFQMN